MEVVKWEVVDCKVIDLHNIYARAREMIDERNYQQ